MRAIFWRRAAGITMQRYSSTSGVDDPSFTIRAIIPPSFREGGNCIANSNGIIDKD
jgi:hypothetical protein